MSATRGIPVYASKRKADFNETNPESSAFIKNNPLPKLTKEDKGKILVVNEDGKISAVSIAFAEEEEY